MPEAENLIDHLCRRWTETTEPRQSLPPDFAEFAKRELLTLDIRGLAYDARGASLQLGDGRLLLLVPYAASVSPGDHPGYGILGNIPERRTLGGNTLVGGDKPIFG